MDESKLLLDSSRRQQASPRFVGARINESIVGSDNAQDQQDDYLKRPILSDEAQEPDSAVKIKRKKGKKKVKIADADEIVNVETASSGSDDSVPFVDDIVLGPLDKYHKYSRFPWTLTVHIMMLMLTCIEVAVVLGPDIEYSTAFTAQLSQQFLTTDPDSFNPPMNDAHVVIYNITELREYVNRTVQNYYYISDDNNLDFFYPKTDDDGFIVPVMMTVHTFDLNATLHTFNLTTTYLGPLELPDEEIKVSHRSFD
jgi:hypothetical protein